MTNEELQACLTGEFTNAEVKIGKQYVEILVQADELHDAAVKLSTLPLLSFDYLFCLSGVDYPEKIQIVYHLESTKHRHTVVLKVNTADRVDPVVDTVPRALKP